MQVLKSREDGVDVDALLEQLEAQRGRDIRLDHHSLIPALFTQERLHRLVPDGVALRLAGFLGGLQWLWPPARRRAIGRMSLLLTRTAREGEVRRLARRQLIDHAIMTEIQMRPWLSRAAAVEGRQHAVDAVESDRPTIIMMSHLHGASSHVLWPAGHPIYAVAHPFLNPETKITRAGWSGYKARLAWRRLCESPVRLVFQGNAYATLEALLERGKVVLIALDVPGSSRTTLAGKTAHLGSGLVNLARETDALIVPLTGKLVNRRPRVILHETVDPRGFDSSQELLDHLAGLLGDEILAAPERVDPNLFWRQIWREDSEPFSEELWRRKRPVRDFRRRVRGKLSHELARLRGS
jgi:hypothetical protein